MLCEVQGRGRCLPGVQVFGDAMQDFMIDLETLGTKPGCVVLSVGAAVFDMATGKVGETYYANLHRDQQLQNGLKVDANTEAWWAKQSKEAREALEGDKVHVSQAARALREIKPSKAAVWCQGASFDVPIWEAVLDAFGLPPLCRFYDVRDTRTAYHMAIGFDPQSVTRKGTYHNALDDSLHQVRCVHAAYRWFRFDHGSLL